MSSIVPPRPRGDGSPPDFAEIVGKYLPQETVAFVIPDTEHDLLRGMCITVALAKNHSDQVVRRMFSKACRFFGTLRETLELSESDQAEHSKLMRIADFPEVPELRFGYVRKGHLGRGIGRGNLNAHVLAYLASHPELLDVACAEPDAIGMVPLIAIDRTSDIMASILKVELIEFTQWCATFYQFRDACMQTVEVAHVWNEDTERFETRRAWLPTDGNGRAFLLVPKDIVRGSPPVSARGYFDDLTPPGSASSTKPVRRSRGNAPSPNKEKVRRTKDDALVHADAHPGQLLTYVRGALENVGPRLEFRAPKSAKKR